MTSARRTYGQRQLLLVLLLYMVGQFTLALHNHDPSLHTGNAEECLVCLVSTSDNAAPLAETTFLNLTPQHSLPLPSFGVLLSQPKASLSQPRAPPVS